MFCGDCGYEKFSQLRAKRNRTHLTNEQLLPALCIFIFHLTRPIIVTKLKDFSHSLQIGTYAGGGGMVACNGGRGGNGGEQGQPTQGGCPGSTSGNAGTQTRGGEGGNMLMYSDRNGVKRTTARTDQTK